MEIEKDYSDSKKASSSPHPPISIVTVVKSEQSRFNEIQGYRQRSESMTSSCTGSIASAFSSPFRLQPRKPILSSCQSTRSGTGACRGRKRTAQSMAVSLATTSTTATSSISPGIASSCYGASPLVIETDRLQATNGGGANMSVSCKTGQETRSSGIASIASLSTPIQHVDVSVPASPFRSVDKTMQSLQIMSLQSPAGRLSSTANLPMSSHHLDSVVSGSSQTKRPSSLPFKAYNSSPMTSSLRTTPTNRCPSVVSASRCNTLIKTPNGSIASPAKIAPLTILTKSSSDIKTSHPTSRQQMLPPRHNGAFCSSMIFLPDDQFCTNGKTEDVFSSPAVLPLVSTPQCSNGNERLSEVTGRTANSSLMSPPPARPGVAKYGIDSVDKKDNIDKLFTSPGKRSRTDARAPSPGRTPSKTPTPGRTPRTPLPTVKLTPRSTCSRSSRNLPTLPSPDDDFGMILSPFIIDTRRSGPSAEGSTTKTNHQEQDPSYRSTSLLFSPKGNLDRSTNDTDKNKTVIKRRQIPLFSPGNESATGSTSTSNKKKLRDVAQTIIHGIKTTSILSPEESVGMLRSIECTSSYVGHFNGGNEHHEEIQSLSDLDDDDNDEDGFILAAPQIVEEERQSNHQRARRRRIQLKAGPDFFPSLKPEAPADTRTTKSDLQVCKDRQIQPIESQVKVQALADTEGLGEPCAAVTSNSDLEKVAAESNSTQDRLTRDLSTPPPIPNITLDSSPPRALNNMKFANSVRVAGADPHSVSVAIAQMAAFNSIATPPISS